MTSSRPTSLCVLGCGSPSLPSYRSSQLLLAHPTVMENSLFPFHIDSHNHPSVSPVDDCHPSVSSSPSPREDFCPLSHSCPSAAIPASVEEQAVQEGKAFTVGFHQHVLRLSRAVPLRWSSGPRSRRRLTWHVLKSPPTIIQVCGAGRATDPSPPRFSLPSEESENQTRFLRHWPHLGRNWASLEDPCLLEVPRILSFCGFANWTLRLLPYSISTFASSVTSRANTVLWYLVCGAGVGRWALPSEHHVCPEREGDGHCGALCDQQCC